MPTDDPRDDEIRLVTLIGRVRKSMRQRFEAGTAAQGITAPQFQVLYSLWQADGTTTLALMRAIGSDAGTITGLVDRLEAKGLVRRRRSAEDRRAVHVFLTPAGRDLEGPLMEALAAVVREALGDMPGDRRSALMAALETMEANLVVPSLVSGSANGAPHGR